MPSVGEAVAAMAMAKEETFQVGDPVETGVALPGIPAGTTGQVREVGPVFLAVELENKRIGYYAPRQLRRRAPLPPPED